MEDTMMKTAENVGLAFQGGCFLAGAISTGVVHALVDRKAFDTFNINAFSGTSAGALVAAMCWKHKLLNDLPSLPDDLQKQWLKNANGFIPTEQAGSFSKVVDRWLLLMNPFYFNCKEVFVIPFLHNTFKSWLVEFVEPDKCMKALFDRYLRALQENSIEDCLSKARGKYHNDETRPRLAVGTAEIHKGDAVVFDDEDLFEALLDAFETACAEGETREAAADRAVEVGARYMTQALMTSGSLDTINGMTRIDDLAGLRKEDVMHKGVYLDGAFSSDPPISPLTNCNVDQIWCVEIFPKRCDADLDSNEKREDRREELLQNAPLEQQYQFINQVNFWVEGGRLKPLTASELADFDDRWSKDAAGRKRIIESFKKTLSDPERYTNEAEIKEAIHKKLTKKYKVIRTHTISLPPDLQPLTDGARIVNSRSFLIDKMNRGYQNTVDFLSRVH
jgi:NTE family protein